MTNHVIAEGILVWYPYNNCTASSAGLADDAWTGSIFDKVMAANNWIDNDKYLDGIDDSSLFDKS